MATTKRKRTPARVKKIVLSICLDTKTVGQLDELADERERSRASVLARAIREYVDREYAILCDVREGEKDHAEGRSVSTVEARAWLKDRIEGRSREPRYGR
jgi:predicted transcriptional regulator